MSWFDDYGSDEYNPGAEDAQDLLGGSGRYTYDPGAEDAQNLLSGSGQYTFNSGAEDAQKLLNTSDKSSWDKFLSTLPSWLGTALGGAGSFLGSKAGIASLLALLAARDRQKPSGGGTTQAYAGYKPLTRTMEQGLYGPIARYAAQGGIMQGYAHGGPVAMEHGGFVMTKKAVDGAGGPQGIRELIPEARMIRGPGTGTSDSIPAYIQGPSGRTPAALSNGEAYVPKRAVRDQGGARQLYALMNQLQRKA